MIMRKLTCSKIETVKKINLCNFLHDHYPSEIRFDKKTNQYRHPVHDSLVINKHAWYRFSTGEGGDTIQFLIVMLNKSFKESVIELFQYAEEHGTDEADYEKVISDFLPPTILSSEKSRVISYLTKRCISKETIDMLLERGLVCEDANHNVVFCNPEKDMYIIKGIGAQRYNQIRTRVSNNYWGFTVGCNPSAIYVCESPIDAISLYECNKRREGIYTAMAGLKIETFRKILREQNPTSDKQVFIAVDWDEAGMNFYKNNGLHKKYPFMGAGKYKGKTKDWNEVLCFLREEQKK